VNLVTQRFTANGVLEWSRSVGTPNALDLFGDLEVAPNGNVVVSHSTNTNGDGITFDIDTTVYDPQGNTVWRRTFTLTNLSHEVVSDLAVDSTDRVVVTGTTATDANPEIGGLTTRGFTVRYDAAGTLLQTLESGSTAVDVGPADNVYLVGFTTFATPPTVTRLDPAGNLVYRTTIAADPVGPLSVVAARVDSRGVVTVAGNVFRTSLDSDYLTIQYAAGGQELGRHRFAGTANFTDRVTDLAITATDAALVTGTSRSSTPAGRSDDIIALRFTAGGTPEPTPPGATPAAPTGLTAAATSRSRIQLTWRDNANNETGFRIERCQGSGCTNFTTIATVGANVTSFRNTGLARDTSYTYRIQAINAAGASAFSNTATAVTPRR
jgi:hypothetical protein